MAGKSTGERRRGSHQLCRRKSKAEKRELARGEEEALLSANDRDWYLWLLSCLRLIVHAFVCFLLLLCALSVIRSLLTLNNMNALFGCTEVDRGEKKRNLVSLNSLVCTLNKGRKEEKIKIKEEKSYFLISYIQSKYFQRNKD